MELASGLQVPRDAVRGLAGDHRLPPLVGQFVSLIKDSSLLSIIAVNEFTHAARNVNFVTYSTLECYLPLAAGYLVLTLPLSLWLRQWEKKLRFET